MSDRLRARIRAGDREAFAEIYEEYARTVYNHAFRLTGDWSTAEEVMADTFLDAWRTREQLEPEGGTVKPWLLGMATNKSRNANRGLGRRLAFLARRPAPDLVADFADETMRPPRRRPASWPPYGRFTTVCGAGSGRCWRYAYGQAWTTRRRPRPWASPWEPCGHGCPERGRGCGN